MAKTKTTKKQTSSNRFTNFQITELQRTIILLVLLAVSVGTLYFVQHNVDANFVEQL